MESNRKPGKIYAKTKELEQKKPIAKSQIR
jgi:hypothetical protein